MHKSPIARVSLGLCVLLGCGGAPADDPAGAVVAASEPGVVSPLVLPVAEGSEPVVMPTVADGEQAKDPAPSVVAPIDPRQLPLEEPAGTGFWLAAGRNGDLVLADLGSEWVVAGAGVMAHLGADGSLEAMPDVLGGLVGPEFTGVLTLSAIAGRWPDPVWMTVESQAHRSDTPPVVYYRKGDRWQRKASKVGPLDWYYGGYAPWVDGKLLGLRLLTTDPGLSELYGDDLPEPVIKKMKAAVKANPPRFEVLAAGVAPTPAPMQIAAGGRPIDFTALPGGEVFVLLEFLPADGDEDSPERTYAVQRFAPGVAEGVVDRLPKLGGKTPALGRGKLVALGADEVYLAGALTDADFKRTALVARFDGQAWATIAAPPGTEVLSLAPGAADELWAVVVRAEEEAPASGLWKRRGEGPWQAVALPKVRTPALAEPRWLFDVEVADWHEVPGEPVTAAELMTLEPNQVLVRDGEVWVVADLPAVVLDDRARRVVLRSRPVKQVLELADSISLAAEMIPLQPLRRGASRCDSGPTWVSVATLESGADADAGAKVAAAFMAEVSEDLQNSITALREYRVRGRRVVAVTLSMVEASETAALLAVVQQFRPTEKHPIECKNPRPLRSFFEHD